MVPDVENTNDDLDSDEASIGQIVVPDATDLDTVTTALPGDVGGLAVGFGSVWAHVFPDEGDPELLQVDAESGEIIGRAMVPELGPTVVVGDDAMWVVGNFRVHRVDPTSLAVETSEFTPPDASLISWYFAAGSLWGVPIDTGDVYRLDGNGEIELALTVDAEENSSAVVGSTLFIEDARSDDSQLDVERSIVVIDLETLTERSRLDVEGTGLGVGEGAVWASTALISDDHPSLFRIDADTLDVTRLPVDAPADLFLDRAVGSPDGAVFQIVQDLDGNDFVLRLDGSMVERGDLSGFPLDAASDGKRLWAVAIDDETTLERVG